MVVQHNLASMNANRNLSVSTGSIKKSSEKLSSGYKINRAADDAAGLTISEKMRSQIRGLTQASENAQDGISFAQSADGTLDEVSVMLKRSKELAVKASTETLTDADRQAIQAEVESICSEIDRVQQSTTFNDFRIFIKEGYPPSEADVTENLSPVKALSSAPVEVTISMVDADGNRINNVGEAKGSGENHFSGNLATMAEFIKGAVNNAVAKLKDAYGSTADGFMSQASTMGVEIGLELGNIDGKNNTLAYAHLQMASGGGNISSGYTLKVDTSDYDPDVIYGSMTPAQMNEKLGNLAATIAHEMTHLVMMDTMPQGMLSGKVTTLPDWFIEGMAQTSSGDDGWVSNGAQTDSQIMNQISKLKTEEYGAGYLGTLYLGQIVGGGKADGSDLSTATIKSGLNSVLAYLSQDQSRTLDDAIRTLTNGKDRAFSGLSDFENTFKNHPDQILGFVKVYRSLVSTDGAGSILGSSLGQTEAALFDPTSIQALSGSSAWNYNLDTDYPIVSNSYAGTLILFPAPDAYDDGKGKLIRLQVGAANKMEQTIAVKRFDISCESIFEGNKMDCSTVDKARKSLASIDKASENVSRVRSYYGAIQNRLEHTIANLDNVVENTTAAESQIRDTDMAKEMVDYTKTNILIQAGNAMLSQAMQQPQNILQLLS